MRISLRLSLAAVLATTTTALAQDLKIAYTGQLMGYYRQDVAGDVTAPRFLLDRLTAGDAKDFKLILGMGDNFAPEYGAALLRRDIPADCVVPTTKISYPRALYKTDLNLPPAARCDNVAAFLMQAGYRAVVPGKEDFLYGSYWLANIAHMLAGDSSSPTNADKRTTLLAANLRVKITGVDGKPKSQCPLLFSPSSQWADASPCDTTKPFDPDEMIENFAYTSSSLGGARTLIVGVVAQNLLDALSNENRSFCASTVALPPAISPPPPTPAGTGPKTKDTLGYASYKAVLCTAKDKTIQAQVIVTDPLKAVVETVTRAIKAPGQPRYDTYVVMAQMTRGEAEELAARLQSQRTLDPGFPAISLVLSAAFDHQSSGTYTLTGDYDQATSVSALGLIPVLTPHPAYDSSHLNHQREPLLAPLSTAQLTIKDGKYTMASASTRTPLTGITAEHTTLGLLLAEIDPKKARIPEHILSPDTMNTPCASSTLIQNAATKAGHNQIDACNIQAMQYILAAMRNIKPNTNDVVFLERRDFFLGSLPAGYIDYHMCDNVPGLSADEIRHCTLQVALDRVLWKGDYIERVMATGADISAMIAASDTLSNQTNQLQQPATTGSWLQTFGLVKTTKVTPAPVPGHGKGPLPDAQAIPIAIANQSSTKFATPTDMNCASLPDPTGNDKDTYCILSNSIEQTPQKDGGFWIATSDHLASDTITYPALSKLPPSYHVLFPDGQGGNKFLTEAIADSLFLPSVPSAPTAPLKASVEHGDRDHGAEVSTQQHRHFQVDSAKIFFGYLGSSADNGDSYLANNFQGASDSRASAVSQYELDAEAQLRGLWTWGNFWPYKAHAVHQSAGFQTDVEYDRSAQGNLNGAADNASYGANNWAIGPLYQFAYPLSPGTKSANYGFMKAAQWAFVVSPQFQRQVRGTDLFFAYSSSSPKVGNDELTVPIDYSFGWNVKEGFRVTAAASASRFQLLPASYFEIGLEEGEQHHVLNSIQLANVSGTTLSCAANSAQPISACVSSATKGNAPTFPLSSTSTLSALNYSDQPAHGLYWDISFKWKLLKSENNFHELDFTATSKGDGFVRRSSRDVLSTQTLYDIPLSLGFTFQALPNLSFAPSGNFFFYSNQIAERQLFIRGFNISMRWYYDRDSHVPFLRQFLLMGPASQDQTKTTKMKQSQ